MLQCILCIKVSLCWFLFTSFFSTNAFIYSGTAFSMQTRWQIDTISKMYSSKYSIRDVNAKRKPTQKHDLNWKTFKHGTVKKKSKRNKQKKKFNNNEITAQYTNCNNIYLFIWLKIDKLSVLCYQWMKYSDHSSALVEQSNYMQIHMFEFSCDNDMHKFLDKEKHIHTLPSRQIQMKELCKHRGTKDVPSNRDSSLCRIFVHCIYYNANEISIVTHSSRGNSLSIWKICHQHFAHPMYGDLNVI